MDVARCARQLSAATSPADVRRIVETTRDVRRAVTAAVRDGPARGVVEMLGVHYFGWGLDDIHDILDDGHDEDGHRATLRKLVRVYAAWRSAGGDQNHCPDASRAD